jgi:glycosyltransferase involved in cell wall biosynthesis
MMAGEKRPNISFVMPVFNRPAFLADAVNSIFSDNSIVGDEVIIVDDGSTDSTPTVLADLAAKHPQIRSLRHRFNKGSAAAGRNTAIDAAANEWIFCLDSDNLLLPGSIAALMKCATDNNADAASLGGRDYFNDDPAKVLYNEIYKPGLITLADALVGHCWPGLSGNYLYTRSSWVRAGRQNEFVGGGIDSWAFGIRQLATGTRFFTLPGTVYKHRVGHESAYTVDEKDGRMSLKALAALIPFLDQLEEETVDYLFAKETRKTWFADLGKRPLKVRGSDAGTAGTQKSFVSPPPLIDRIRGKIARTIAPKPAGK